MSISEVIAKLESIREEHGDVEVFAADGEDRGLSFIDAVAFVPKGAMRGDEFANCAFVGHAAWGFMDGLS